MQIDTNRSWRIRVILLTGALTLSFLLTSAWQSTKASAYGFQTANYYLTNYSATDHAWTNKYISYGDWSCVGGLCSIPIYAMQQYVNVVAVQDEFTCWYQEVYTYYGANNRAGSRSMTYYTTPWYNYQSSWGYADSFQGDQLQLVSIGTNSSECSYYGAGGGAHIFTSITRNSSAISVYGYGW